MNIANVTKEKSKARPKEEVILMMIWVISLLLLIGSIKMMDLGISLATDELFLVLELILLFIYPMYLVGKLLPIQWVKFLDEIRSKKIVSTLTIPATIILSGLFVWFLFGSTVNAQFALIDDHEVVEFLGVDKTMSIQEVFPTLITTEVGRLGEFTRYRPIYYIFRILETVTWGNRPALWHAFRIVILFFSLVISWLLIKQYSNWLIAGAICAYTLTYPYWVDIIARLGPSESYAVIGLAIYAAGFYFSLRDREDKVEKALAGASILVGSIVCFGSKENFLLLILPNIYLLCQSVRRQKKHLFIPLIASLAFGLFITADLIVALSRSGVDIYENHVSMSYRLSLVINGFMKPQFFLAISLLVLIIIIVGILALVTHQQRNRRALLAVFLWLLTLTLLYTSQYIFYNGQWPTISRYDFPGMLYIPGVLFVLYWLVNHLEYPQTGNRIKQATTSAVFLAMMCVIILKGYSATLEATNLLTLDSIRFSQQIENISTLLKQQPNRAFVLETSDSHDYEPVFSYAIYLRNNKVENPFFLHFDSNENSAGAELEQALSYQLMNLSYSGNQYYWPLSKLESFHGDCYSLKLSNTKMSPLLDCIQVKKLRQEFEYC